MYKILLEPANSDLFEVYHVVYLFIFTNCSIMEGDDESTAYHGNRKFTADSAVERISSFKFFGVHFAEDITWFTHTGAVVKKVSIAAKKVWHKLCGPQVILPLRAS